MPLPSTTRSPYEEALIIQTELDYDVGEQLEIVGRDVASLNSDQRNVFGAVMAVINDPEPYSKVFFVVPEKHSCITHSWPRFVH